MWDLSQLDNQILIEPFVENLVEYNIAITSAFGEVRLPAIEKPLKQGDLLDFKTKYLNGKNRASKLAGPSSEGMASLQREINPKELTAKQRQIIEKFALNSFKLIGQSGAPRIDFLTNSKTKEIWLNEINPFPGSLGYYLWEKSEPKVNFTKLLDNLIQEGFKLNKYHNNFTDPVKTGSNIFE